MKRRKESAVDSIMLFLVVNIITVALAFWFIGQLQYNRSVYAEWKNNTFICYTGKADKIYLGPLPRSSRLDRVGYIELDNGVILADSILSWNDIKNSASTEQEAVYYYTATTRELSEKICHQIISIGDTGWNSDMADEVYRDLISQFKAGPFVAIFILLSWGILGLLPLVQEIRLRKEKKAQQQRREVKRQRRQAYLAEKAKQGNFIPGPKKKPPAAIRSKRKRRDTNSKIARSQLMLWTGFITCVAIVYI